MILEGKKKNYVISLIMVTLVTILLNASFYWPNDRYNQRKVWLYAITIICIFLLPLFIIRIKVLNDFVTRKRYKITQMLSVVYINRKRVFVYIVAYGIVLLLAWFFTNVISHFHYHEEFNLYRFFFVATVFVLTLTFFCLRKIAGENPEIVFLITVLILGIFLIRVSPSFVGVSWDDEIHYERTLSLANYANGIMYKADMKIIDEQYSNLANHFGYDRESKEAYADELEEMYVNKELVPYSFSKYGVWSVAYIPSAIGIVVGRGLGLSYTHVFMMGKLFNLLMYAMLVFKAIKKIKYGKILIAVIGLIPTNVFMAASYAYDPWVIGFIIFGFSYFFSIMQDEKKICVREMTTCIVMIVLGCLPKAIYFPLLFPFIFVSQQKFKNVKQWKQTILMIVFAGVFLVMIFLIPILLSGTGINDMRGGADVNSIEQIKFIFKNPIYFMKILYSFFKVYLSISSIGYGFQHFAYMGYGMFWGIVTLIVVVVAFLDRDENKSISCWIRISGVIGCGAAMILVTTALYISFTGVGANTVAGMHDRYVFPIIFPMLYFIGSDRVKHDINRSAFSCLPMFIIALTFLYNINMLCVSQY